MQVHDKILQYDGGNNVKNEVSYSATFGLGLDYLVRHKTNPAERSEYLVKFVENQV